VLSYVMRLVPTHNVSLGALTFDISINKLCFWRMCIKNDTKIFILSFYQRVLIVLIFIVCSHTRVTYLICVGVTVKQGYLFLYI